MDEKRCSKCRKTKDISEFSKNRKEKDGHSGWCKSCHKEASAKRRLLPKIVPSHKKCSKCHKTKAISEFHKAANSSDGHVCLCKVCKSKSVKAWWRALSPEDKAAQMLAKSKSLRALRDLVQTHKGEQGCCRCPENDPDCLQFHHPGDDKLECVAELVRSGNADRVWAEIAKCIVLCANCHFKLHAKELRAKRKEKESLDGLERRDTIYQVVQGPTGQGME
jgi:hypothetical protein